MKKTTFELNNPLNKPFIFYDDTELIKQLRNLPILYQTVPNGWELVKSVEVAELVPTKGQISYGQLIETVRVFIKDKKEVFGFAYIDEGLDNNRVIGIFKRVPLIIKS